jgi:CBS domain-containing protein
MSTVLRIEQIIEDKRGPILTIDPDATAAVAARKMAAHHVGCLIVSDPEGQVVGILTERDIVDKVIAKSLDPGQTQVDGVMTKKVVTCGQHTPLAKAQQMMAKHGIRHLPIIDHGRPVGMISGRDILAHQLATVQAVVRRQSDLLNEVESEHPGITHLPRDDNGRIVF